MCGIAGIFEYGAESEGPAPGEIAVMRDAMAVRGPDGCGEWLSGDGRVALGHRRLAIIDLRDQALQPMTDSVGQLTIVFNGEIYNYRELRRDLETRGHRFCTESDTEVILNLFSESGRAFGVSVFGQGCARNQAALLCRRWTDLPLRVAGQGAACLPFRCQGPRLGRLCRLLPVGFGAGAFYALPQYTRAASRLLV